MQVLEGRLLLQELRTCPAADDAVLALLLGGVHLGQERRVGRRLQRRLQSITKSSATRMSSSRDLSTVCNAQSAMLAICGCTLMLVQMRNGGIGVRQGGYRQETWKGMRTEVLVQASSWGV